MGEITDLRWSWESADNNIRVGYVSCRGRVTPAEIVDHIRAITPDVNPDDIQVNYATVVWRRPATEEEIADRQRQRANADARREAWERQTWERLRRKYGEV